MQNLAKVTILSIVLLSLEVNCAKTKIQSTAELTIDDWHDDLSYRSDKKTQTLARSMKSHGSSGHSSTGYGHNSDAYKGSSEESSSNIMNIICIMIALPFTVYMLFQIFVSQQSYIKRLEVKKLLLNDQMHAYEDHSSQADQDQNGKLVYYNGPIEIRQSAQDNDYKVLPVDDFPDQCIYIWRKVEMYQFSAKSSQKNNTCLTNDSFNYHKGWYSTHLDNGDAENYQNPAFDIFKSQEFCSEAYVLNHLKLNESQTKRIAFACKKPLTGMDIVQFKKQTNQDMILQGLNHVIEYNTQKEGSYIYMTQSHMSYKTIDRYCNGSAVKDELNMLDDFSIGDIRIKYQYAIAQDLNVQIMAKQSEVVPTFEPWNIESIYDENGEHITVEVTPQKTLDLYTPSWDAESPQFPTDTIDIIKVDKKSSDKIVDEDKEKTNEAQAIYISEQILGFSKYNYGHLVLTTLLSSLCCLIWLKVLIVDTYWIPLAGQLLVSCGIVVATPVMAFMFGVCVSLIIISGIWMLARPIFSVSLASISIILVIAMFQFGTAITYDQAYAIVYPVTSSTDSTSTDQADTSETNQTTDDSDSQAQNDDDQTDESQESQESDESQDSEETPVSILGKTSYGPHKMHQSDEHDLQ